MKKEEVRQLLVLLKEYFPNSFIHHTAEGSKLIFSVWLETFKDEDTKLVQTAVMKLIQSNTTGFAPTIGEIREKMLELTGVHIMTADDVWNRARRFWCNLGTRNPSEIEPRYKELPEEVKRMFTIDDMIHMADMQTADVINYEKPRFMKEYRHIEAQHKAELLGGSITGSALGYAENLMLERVDDEDDS